MFQELNYGPFWCEPDGPGAKSGVKLVDGDTPSKVLKPASIRRPDKTVSFQGLFAERCWGPGVEISDETSMSGITTAEFLKSYWGRECFSKLDLSSKEEELRLEGLAIEKLIAKEKQTREVNERLRCFALTGRGLTSETADVVREAKRIVKRVLGRFSWDECVSLCRWGPGASTEFPRRRSAPTHKWDAVTHVTADCRPLVVAFSRYARWSFDEPIIVDSNCITTVPKKTTARRTIAKEPTWNMFFQLAIEGAIRRRLKKVGLLVDVKGFTAQDRHKRLAQAGSRVEGLFPTLDFSDASNSISRGLCGLLVPSEWLVPLCMTRSNRADLPDGRKLDLEMFSTMGNGYTFVLMTLLIYAVSSACVGSATSVFGDDLVLPDASRLDRVVRVFRELGFELNLDKSFARAPFRESCGGHFYRGYDVTPPYFKRRLDNLPAYITYANALTRVGLGLSDEWFYLLKEIPRKFRGPAGFGDAVAIAPWDMVTPSWDNRLQAWRGTMIVGVQPTKDPSERGRLRHGVYPVVHGEGLEVDREDHKKVVYRTGTWTACRW